MSGFNETIVNDESKSTDLFGSKSIAGLYRWAGDPQSTSDEYPNEEETIFFKKFPKNLESYFEDFSFRKIANFYGISEELDEMVMKYMNKYQTNFKDKETFALMLWVKKFEVWKEYEKFLSDDSRMIQILVKKVEQLSPSSGFYEQFGGHSESESKKLFEDFAKRTLFLFGRMPRLNEFNSYHILLKNKSDSGKQKNLEIILGDGASYRRFKSKYKHPKRFRKDCIIEIIASNHSLDDHSKILEYGSGDGVDVNFKLDTDTVFVREVLSDEQIDELISMINENVTDYPCVEDGRRYAQLQKIKKKIVEWFQE